MLCYENQTINGMDTNRDKRLFDNYALPFQIWDDKRWVAKYSR
jgi:hypothetical protein